MNRKPLDSYRTASLVALATMCACVGTVGPSIEADRPPAASAAGAAASAPTGGAGSTATTPTGGAGSTATAGAPAAVSSLGAGAGSAPLRRLTRDQYLNTVRDLLGLASKPSATFSADGRVYGFASNANLVLQEIQLEEYRQAADQLASIAVRNVAGLASCAAGADEARCAQDFITRFGKRAYRRPLDAVEVQRYQQLFASGRAAGGSFASGIGLVVEAMLQSPSFLYLVELGTGPRDSAGQVALGPYEIAARLSYLFWNSMPDDVLFAAADGGHLGTVEEIVGQARRLLAHPRARDAIVSFHEQWLDIERIEQTEKDAKRFSGPLEFTVAMRAAMREQIARFVDNVVREGDGRVATLLTAGFGFVMGPLNAVYGLAVPPDTQWRRVDLPADQRSGLLTMPAILAVNAHQDQPALVLRGKLVRERLLCQQIPAPPPGVPDAPPLVDPKAPTKDRFAIHRQQPSCAGCHNLMDPLGEPFELYDAIGRYRRTDSGHPIDPSATITATAESDGPVRGPIELVARLAAAAEVQRCVATNWFRFAFGRPEGADDQATIEEAARAAGGRVPELLLALPASREFRFRKAVNPL